MLTPGRKPLKGTSRGGKSPTLVVRLSRSLMNRLEWFEAEHNIRRSEVVREAIEKYLDERE